MSHILLLGLGYCTTKTLLDDFIYFNLQNEKLFEENESMRETSSSERSSLPRDDQQQTQPETSRSNKIKMTDACDDNIDLDKAMEVLNYTDDSYDTFGKHITAELRKYDPITLAYVKKAIMDILFQADTEMLPGTRQQGYYTQQYSHSANVQNSEQYEQTSANEQTSVNSEDSTGNTEQFTTLSLL